MVHENLMAQPPETRLPDDPVADRPEDADLDAAARSHPASSLAWARLAEAALSDGRDVEAYAFARTGYHRGLDALRRNGWRGQGPIPWEHEPNRGFLRALAALATASDRIGDSEESDRCRQFLRDSTAEGYAALFDD
jgi:Protein of unknown function (DUF3151)